MRVSTLKQTLIIILTICTAMVLTIMPLPSWAIWLRPEWVMLIIAYWCLTFPERISVGVAWMIGLLLDVLLGSLLGQHALALAVVSYFIVKFHPRIRLYPIWQKTLVIFILSLIYLALLYWVQGLMGIIQIVGNIGHPL